LCAFHRLAYGADFEDDGLDTLVGHPATEIAVRETVPTPQVAMPAPNAPLELLPKDYSVSRYQTLLACPYRFFAAECLQLRAPEEVREILAKNEYGERIHRVLEIFHQGSSDDNAAFPEPITDAQRTEAIAHLRNLSRREFAREIRDNFLHRGWLHRWLDLVPAYIDWQIVRNREWRISDVEVRAAITRHCGTGSYEIRGRLDRIDNRDGGAGIVDYKTGAVPDASAVAAGEAVQLPLYALLHAQPVDRVEYLRLDGDVKSAVILEGELLRALSEQCGDRLDKLVDDLHAGATLPAWGDEITCGFCEFGPVCRRQIWHEGSCDE
jgi:ATP-dependent helicase/nuclease subunit B